MLHLDQHYPMNGSAIRALSCVVASLHDRGNAAAWGNARRMPQSVISKRLPVQLVGNIFETTFNPGGGGV